MRRVGSNLFGNGAGRGHQLIARHHARHQVPLRGLARVDGLAGQGQLGRARQADDARQQPRAAVAGNDAQLDEALGELGLFGGHADVAHAGQVEARADGVAVHRRDHRHLEVEQCQRQLLDAQAVLAAQLHRRQFAVAAHVAHIAARREGRARTREDHRAHRMVGVDAVDGGQELRHGRVAGERVAALGVVHRQRDDVAVLFVVQKVGHQRISSIVNCRTDGVALPSSASPTMRFQ